jgi:hypothetical protein
VQKAKNCAIIYHNNTNFYFPLSDEGLHDWSFYKGTHLIRRDIQKIHKTFYIFYVNIENCLPITSILQPFVLFGAGGSGKSALLSKTALQSIKVCTLNSQKLEIFAVLDF